MSLIPLFLLQFFPALFFTDYSLLVQPTVTLALIKTWPNDVGKKTLPMKLSILEQQIHIIQMLLSLL